MQALESLFNNTCKAWSPATLLKRDYKTGVFLFSLQHFLEHFICSYFCFIANYLTGFFLSGKLCLESIFFCLYQIFSGAVLASQVRFFTRKFQPFRIKSLFSFLNHNLFVGIPAEVLVKTKLNAVKLRHQPGNQKLICLYLHR